MPSRTSLVPALARALSGLVLLVSSACAPPADLRPPSALVFTDDRKFEVGAGLVNVSKRPYVDEPSRNIGQTWLTMKAAPWVSFSAISAFDSEGALGGGAALFRVLRADRVVLGTSVEAGYAWAGLSASSALRLFEDSWIYTAPRVYNWGDSVCIGVPLGLSVHIAAGFHLRTELQWSWEDLKYYNRRRHLAIAAAYAF